MTVAAQSEVRIVFARANTEIVGSNPPEAWMSVFVQVAALRRPDPPSKEPYRHCKRSRI
jgi:hypothetical protein